MFFDYRCVRCGEEFEVMHKSSEVGNKFYCECGGEGTKLISHHQRVIQTPGYYDMSLDAWVDGANDRKKIAKSKGLEEVGTRKDMLQYNQGVIQGNKEKRSRKLKSVTESAYKEAVQKTATS